MALSNIWREPRREITEILLGVVMMVPLVWVDYRIGIFIHNHDTPPEMPIGLGMVLGIAIMMSAFLGASMLLMVFHGIGQGTADWLEDHGIRLRPKRRY